MFCTKCGAPLKEGLKFCTSCGAEVETPAAQARPRTKRQGGIGWKRLLASAALVLITLAAALGLFSRAAAPGTDTPEGALALLVEGLAPAAALLTLYAKIPASIFNSVIALVAAPLLCVLIRTALKRSHLKLA